MPSCVIPSSVRASRLSQELTAIVLLAMPLFVGCRSVKPPIIAPAWNAANAEHPLSHDDCVRLASMSAPTAASWEARYRAARAALDAATAWPNPTFSASWEDIGLGTGTSALQQTFSLAYALSDCLARSRRVTGAHYDLDAERAALATERQRLATRVRHAYDDLIAKRQAVDLRSNLEHIAGDARNAAARFVEQGLAAPLERDLAEAAVADARDARRKAEEVARAAELAFGFALGFDSPVELILADPLTREGEVEEEDAEHSTLVRELGSAAQSRPELREAEARYRAALERLHLECSGVQYLPTVAAGPRFARGEDTRGVASIDVVLPLFDHGNAARDAEEADALERAADLARISRQIAAEVATTALDLEQARASLDRSRRQFARRSSIREKTERLFRAGELPLDALIDTRREEASARLTVLDAEVEHASAVVDHETAIGHGTGPSSTPIDRSP